MDFIKTSSLRALIELTFQRNWNGLIWMSRKGVTTKRVKTVQTALSRTAPKPRSPAGRGTMFRARPNHIRPTEVSAKVQNRPADHASRPGKHSRGRPSQRHAKPRTTKRASRETRPRGRATRSRTTADASVRAGKDVPRPAEISSAKSIRSTTPADRETSAPTVPTRPRPDVRPIVPHDRPNAAVDPKPF
ncbi:unnamed protein product [Microthlaspi erraticum]|uniref:Uncharacterized protein n=1 Tax=Microthlaspi erraticum TaxID=1685480 RepID=A0A6D2KDL8_9BRAS|nr:unnamed protein product [Microthlaspi erraticum]